ncbi:lipid IV(A) 3-deoxy-D-manno-octulosonic acid transferase [Microbulbifer yueqingensis]|uniref:3-deoxy-D-manno-octulosonic acid transferase n=1 Tax=Microbulbifer yueqingensis TaxID=658219 RepID=A0A1G8YAI4_9GAMM|nr:lipid IV(A) 3-deoxy-D-manno-octulosonic acid transferase [Microbulbifer yueqingensis]SDJ99899.1 3-deoxy-D-manno-octulosonic-acid transferase [Microbulbifer yueqingensis]
MQFLYTWLLRLALPFILLRQWWRGRIQPEYRLRWRERLGRVPVRASRAPLVWVHSVSVGETLAAVPVIEQLAARHPDWQWLVTTTTPTGSERVESGLRPMLDGRLLHYYLPYDLPEYLRRFLSALHPRLLVIMETELWPNLLAACERRDIPVLLANARLSDKSAKGYARVPGLTRKMLRRLSRVVAQYPEDARRFVSLGLPEERVVAVGNIKFDLEIGMGMASEAQALAHQWRGPLPGKGARPVWLAASTHDGEEALVLDAFADLLETIPDLLLVLVPRHPQRFEVVAELVHERGFTLKRRSEGGAPAPSAQVLLGDSMGELLRFYGACDVAFVGGSLVPVGGHNMIEPAAWGVPVVCGPHLHNFSRVASLLQDARALRVAENPAQMAAQVRAWLEDSEERHAAGARGRQVASENTGALQRLVNEIDALAGP